MAPSTSPLEDVPSGLGSCKNGKGDRMRMVICLPCLGWRRARVVVGGVVVWALSRCKGVMGQQSVTFSEVGWAC
eukprot:749996-Hanusia_phi.AAC.1